LHHEAAAARRPRSGDEHDFDHSNDDYEPVTLEQRTIAVRKWVAVLGVVRPVEGEPTATGLCHRCKHDDLPLWPTGRLLMCGPCWQARETTRAKLSANQSPHERPERLT